MLQLYTPNIIIAKGKMNITAVIAEFNPLHSGHKYIIDKIKSLRPDNQILIIMSGNFTQRGEPSVYNKWQRTKMALACGADAVIELPFPYAVSDAESFALGACKILNELGCIDALSFGIENTDIENLRYCAEFMYNESDNFKTEIKSQLKKGFSLGQAKLNALLSHNKKYADILKFSNNILAVEYMKFLIKLKSNITPLPIERKGCAFNDRNLSDNFSSASALRIELGINGASELFLANTPAECIQYYKYCTPLTDYKYLYRAILMKLRTLSAADIAQLRDVTEGLEYRIKSAANISVSYKDLVNRISTRRYSKSRVKRILLYSVFSLTKTITEDIKYQKLYARVLGVRKNSNILSVLSKTSKIPVVIRPKDFGDMKLLNYDIIATEIYSTLTEKPEALSDFTKKLIVV